MTCTSENDRVRGRRHRSRERQGATAVETGFVLIVFLTAVLGMLDLGISVYRYHVLAQAARQGARQAIVHGSLADRLGTWGPEDYTTTGDADDPIAQAIRPSLVVPEEYLKQVTIEVDWIDGGNEFHQDHRVQVTVSGPYQLMLAFIFEPIMTLISDNPDLKLQATSTMAIAH